MRRYNFIIYNRKYPAVHQRWLLYLPWLTHSLVFVGGFGIVAPFLLYRRRKYRLLAGMGVLC